MDTQSLITLAVVFGIIGAMWYMKRPDLDAATARKLIADGARLIDVRSPGEYSSGHIDGARNIPVDRIGSADLGPKDRPIVVYCASGTRSAIAKRTLKSKGFSAVYNLGPMSAWQ